MAVLIGIAWTVSIGLATRPLFIYENTAGMPGAPGSHWPSTNLIQRSCGKFTLVMFAHPDCPCTRASIAELGMLMTKLPGKLDAVVEFRKPGASERDARTTDLWQTAAAIPGASVRFDNDGQAVRAFGAAVSGQTMLYDREGRLVFSGGITAFRRHVGDSPGADAIIRRVSGGQAPIRAAVFGCSLRDPDTQQLQREPAWSK